MKSPVLLLFPLLLLNGCVKQAPPPPPPAERDPAVPRDQAPAVDGPTRWTPVRIGAGGFVTGFVTHPLDASVRYCRTDVGNAYRWDGQEWIPMLVEENMPSFVSEVPAITGVESVAVDPADPGVVYLTFRLHRSKDVEQTHPRLPGNIYKSVDGGRTFTAGGMSVEMDPNGRWRAEGERIGIDPLNPDVLYYGTVQQGLWRSRDGAATWEVVLGQGAPDPGQNVIGIFFDVNAGPLPGRAHSRRIYVLEGAGAVRMSDDGGESWTDISEEQELAGKVYMGHIDREGSLYVTQSGSRNLWRWREGAWAKMTVRLNQVIKSVAVDPQDPQRIWVTGIDSSLGRSFDGGTTWVSLGGLRFANTFSWLPQPEGWRSNAGVTVDRDGMLWMAQGNEGMLRWTPNDQPPLWTIDSGGIEELVTHDAVYLPGGRIVVAVHDATGMVIDDPDRFTARQFPLQTQLISNGTSVAQCPNDPMYLVITSADVNWTGKGKSVGGYSLDGGDTWHTFAGLPTMEDGKEIHQAGRIVAGRRGDWAAGEDHLVWLPSGGHIPYYSHDGGKTWHASEGFPAGNGFWNFALKRRSLQADPFVVDRFYLVGSWRGGFYVSNDGGKTWEIQAEAGLPHFLHHAQLATNPKLEGDLWFAAGWEGASEQGLWRSRDGGKTFSKLPDIAHAVTLAIGAGRGGEVDADFTVYFIGQLHGTPDWGVFRSTNAGVSWERIAGHPGGIFDQPTCMTASRERFGDLVVGFTGNSFVKGRVLP